MPRRLLDRCRPDCIREFRAAARERYDDALVLATNGQRTGAIYLWGYTVEMTIKAAYFSFIGLLDTDVITWSADLRPAINRGRAMGIPWPPAGEGHNLRAWADLLVAVRGLSPVSAYASSFKLQVRRCGQRMEGLWRETLRYRRNNAYLHEMQQVREAAEWFLGNADSL